MIKTPDYDICDIFLSILNHQDLCDNSLLFDLDIMVEKACGIMVLCQGVFYAKYRQKLFKDKHLIKSDSENIKEIDYLYLKHINSIMGTLNNQKEQTSHPLVSKMVKYHRTTALSEIQRELKRVYNFEYLDKRTQKSLHFEINNDIFQWIDVIPVVFELRYQKQPYRSSINNMFWD